MQLFTQSRIARFLIAWVLAVALVSTSAHAADSNEDTIRASTNEVRIAFAASDREGHVVKSLRSSDVAVADNGLIIRQFRSFRPAMESPLDVVLLLDASGSEASQLAEEIATARSFLASSAWEERDRVSIVAFGGLGTQLICMRNCRGADAQSKLNALRTDGLTPLYDALVKAAEILQENRDPESRPAMILFSDGFDDFGILKWPTSAVCSGPPLDTANFYSGFERELGSGGWSWTGEPRWSYSSRFGWSMSLG